MDVISAARELGKTIQADERYKRIVATQEKNDADKDLQDAIGAFNLQRTQLNLEVQKPEKDTEKIKELDAELKEMYQKIFENENMKAFSAAKSDMEEMIGHINMIISGSASGQDPDLIDPSAASCASGCGGCTGCK
ncbi:MAG: YlbF family regulator [Oscillospiraceae bacterium]|nr:YlbF family regulator [Oscillospiraceae bacterium]